VAQNPTPGTDPIKTEILAAARDEFRFDGAAIAPVDPDQDRTANLFAFLAGGHHATMDWLAERFDQRVSPRGLWPEAKSVIMLTVNYGPDENPLDLLEKKDRGAISVYARHRDYHDVIKKRLKAMARWLIASYGGAVKVFVDTAPVMEKPLAEAAGLGWQGKHTNLVSRDFGSWLFLGSIFTTLDLPIDSPEADHCGTCRACLDVCPTDAFPAPYQIDARRCLSYLTIEHKGPIPEEFRAPMGNRIYGCDDCLAVCPWNKFAQTTREAKLQSRDDLRVPPLADFLTIDDATFRNRFSGSPIKRIGWARFVRNVLIAAGNSGDPVLLPVIKPYLSSDNETLSDAARWAHDRLTSA